MRYNGALTGRIEVMYVGGMRPIEIYRKLKDEFAEKSPAQSTVYDICRKFDMGTQEQRLTRKLSDEAEVELRLIIESHRRIMALLREEKAA